MNFFWRNIINSFWGNSHASRAQVLADIDSVMTAILKYCEDNMDSFTQEERLSFMNEHSSLSGVQFNKGATPSALLQALDDCKNLKFRIETAYIRHLIIRGTVSPAATTAMGGCYIPSPSLRTECHKSTQTDSTLAPSTELVDPNPTITTVDPRAQVLTDIDSVTEAILEYFTDNWDSLTQEQRLSFEDECFSLSDVRLNEGMTHSALTKVLDDRKELKLRIETACRKHQVDDIKRMLACRAETTTGIGRKSADTDSTLATDTSDSTVSSSNAESHKTSSNTSAASSTSPASTGRAGWPRPPFPDSMIFGGNSFVGSPTFNIDSEGAIGATYYDNSPSSSGSEADETSSIISSVPHTSSTFTGCMILGGNSTVKGATVNIGGSVGASVSRTPYHGNGPSVQVSKKKRQSSADHRTQIGVTVNPNGVVSSHTNSPSLEFSGQSLPPAGDETSLITSAAFMKKIPRASIKQKNCMIFSNDSVVTGATFNIDSDGATGAIISSHNNSPSVQVSGKRRQPAAARPTQKGVTVSPNGVVYISPGTTAGSPTVNIQSPNASGAQFHS